MKKLNKKQPTPPSKKYTAKDSAEFEAVGRRFDANMAKLKANTKGIYNTAGGREGSRIFNAPPGLVEQTRRQLDSMDKNPYAPTFIEREKAKRKANSGGGMKSTKVASKPMAKASAVKSVAKKITKKKK